MQVCWMNDEYVLARVLYTKENTKHLANWEPEEGKSDGSC